MSRSFTLRLLSLALFLVHQSPFGRADESNRNTGDGAISNQEITGLTRNKDTSLDTQSIPLSCWHDAKKRFTIGTTNVWGPELLSVYA